MSKLGLKEVVAMGVGGIIGGGIFAVLGVAAHLSGNAAAITYFIAGLIALASGYAYYHMTAMVDEEGGSFTFLEHYVSNKILQAWSMDSSGRIYRHNGYVRLCFRFFRFQPTRFRCRVSCKRCSLS